MNRLDDSLFIAFGNTMYGTYEIIKKITWFFLKREEKRREKESKQDKEQKGETVEERERERESTRSI